MRPSKPPRLKSGMKTRMMISVAKTIELRISLDALKITAAGDCDQPGLRVLPQPPEDVLDVDDGVIDQLTNRDGESAERHRVDADSEIRHRDDGRHERQRNCRKADERRSEIPQEQKQNDGDEQAAFEQRLLNIVDRTIDEGGLLKGLRLDRDVGGQRPFTSTRASSTGGDFESVGVGLLLNRRDDVRMHIEAAVATLHCRDQAHIGDVLHKNGRRVSNSYHRIRQILDVSRGRAPGRSTPGRPLKKAARCVHIGGADSILTCL